MTVSELIERLQELNPDAEVRLAVQPSWPFENEIAGVVDSAALNTSDLDEDEREIPEDVVWIADGGQIDYLSPRVFDAL
jgi:hypothetical protein